MSVPRAPRPGALAERPVVPGVRLPPGRLILADPNYAQHPVDGPVGWVSLEPVKRGWDTWVALRAQFAETGLWPVIFHGLDDGDLQRPWGDGELDPVDLADVDKLGEGLFAELWEEVTEYSEDDESDADELAPFGREFPGLAPPPAAVRPIHEIPGPRDAVHVGLVPATRPADVPAVIGWTGPTNFTTTDRISAVLRSWEERFGAELVSLGFDTMILAVGRVPSSVSEALPIAAEHFAFCPDAVWQGTGTLQALGESLVGMPGWSFWWD